MESSEHYFAWENGKYGLKFALFWCYQCIVYRSITNVHVIIGLLSGVQFAQTHL